MTTQSGTSTAPITLNSYGTGNTPTVPAASPETASGSTATTPLLTGCAAFPAAMPASASQATATLVRNSSASNNAVGIKIGTGSDFGKYTGNTLTNNNIMNVNDAGHELRNRPGSELQR